MATDALKTNMDMLNGQQLFNAADIAVVGQFAGDKALAAVGANTFVINLLINLFVGISVGANVVVANSIGAQSYRAVTRSVHTSVMVSFFSGILLSFIGVFFARQILSAISTPEDILDMAVRYLQVYFAGIPFVMLYNFVAAILRGKGDTKRPLYVLLATGAINVALNVLFVAGFGWGVTGVAIATVIANALSAGTLFYFMLHEVGPFKLEFWKLRITPVFLGRIMRVGLPAGLQGVVFSFSNVCLQSAINSLGSATVAASAAALNYEFIVYYWLNSFSHACVTFVGQNYGAKNIARCRSAVRWTILLATTSTFALSLLCCLFANQLLSVFTSDPEIISRNYRDWFYPHECRSRRAVHQCLLGCVLWRTAWHGAIFGSGAHLRGWRLRYPNPLGDFCIPDVPELYLADGGLPSELDCHHNGPCRDIHLSGKTPEILM